MAARQMLKSLFKWTNVPMPCDYIGREGAITMSGSCPSTGISDNTAALCLHTTFNTRFASFWIFHAPSVPKWVHYHLLA